MPSGARVFPRSSPSSRCSAASPRGARGQPSPAGSASRCPDNSTSTFRSEEHTSELQSQSNLVCRLLLEKKKKNKQLHMNDLSFHQIYAKHIKCRSKSALHQKLRMNAMHTVPSQEEPVELLVCT